MAKIKLKAAKGDLAPVFADTADISGIHTINNGMTINLRSGGSVGIKHDTAEEMFRTVTRVISYVRNNEPTESLKALRVVMEEQSHFKSDKGDIAVNKLGKVLMSGYDFISR